MDVLRHAVADNREVFLEVTNRLSEEINTKNNNVVEDIEKIIEEIDIGNGMAAKFKAMANEEFSNITKTLSDLEAHFNTTMITVRRW
jgi:hypothetical protein